MQLATQESVLHYPVRLRKVVLLALVRGAKGIKDADIRAVSAEWQLRGGPGGNNQPWRYFTHEELILVFRVIIGCLLRMDASLRAQGKPGFSMPKFAGSSASEILSQGRDARFLSVSFANEEDALRVLTWSRLTTQSDIEISFAQPSMQGPGQNPSWGQRLRQLLVLDAMEEVQTADDTNPWRQVGQKRPQSSSAARSTRHRGSHPNSKRSTPRAQTYSTRF